MKFIDAPRKIFDSLKQRGWNGTLKHSFLWLRYHYVMYEENAFDRKYGTDTTARVQPKDFGIESKSLEYASKYEPVTSDIFDRMIRAIPIDPREYVFIDLGSGKGRALMFAARFSFQKIIGVELSPKLHAIAQENIRRFQRKTGFERDFELHCVAAEDYDFPQANTVLYLYNPFHGPVLAAVLSRLQQSLRVYPRELIVLYRNPVHAVVFESQPFLRPVPSNSKYAVYRGLTENPSEDPK
jgi:SAM-dependent methyltransferase